MIENYFSYITTQSRFQRRGGGIDDNLTGLIKDRIYDILCKRENDYKVENIHPIKVVLKPSTKYVIADNI